MRRSAGTRGQAGLCIKELLMCVGGYLQTCTMLIPTTILRNQGHPCTSCHTFEVDIWLKNAQEDGSCVCSPAEDFGSFSGMDGSRQLQLINLYDGEVVELIADYCS
ncbi:hypothetical protein KC19_9G142600 [Ceratodon purpureus]|uniref:Uncharacterized protein n=1 Tax=Ceratodon purpureus TaxID=3225 RepID=A0A8T0GTQ4_CERPU|nr:hypothetical protein KC19_9G142600 [Ceratodon purpureus]